MPGLLISLKRSFQRCFSWFHHRLIQWSRPKNQSLLVATFIDLTRTQSELLAENALLRQQLIILRRQVKRPACNKTDRVLLVVLARAARCWKQALYIVQPDTLLGWHRHLFRWFWRWKSKPALRKPKLAAETITLIQSMVLNNRLWGAESIRGELLKLGIRVSKRTIQKYMRQERPRPSSQTWSTFLHNHASEIWACDFLPVTDLFFRSLFAFFIIELQSRKVLHVGVTRHPTDAWVAQQLREASPFGEAPRFLICDHDSKFGPLFARVANGTGIKLLRTPIRAPRANACCERFLGSVRRECLVHLLILREQQLHRILQAYRAYFNQARPHQGIQQQIPEPPAAALPSDARAGSIRAVPVLGGLHHDYRRVA
ncbi:MAG TPA: integrase core domain-containing protein [Ktedonobacteraceae bacterium]